jgi:transcriptional regulator with XRE-family HTH domain
MFRAVEVIFHEATMTAPDPEDFSKIDALVGARVRLLRERRKMSQTTLGQQIGVSFQQVQKYERGANRISASSLFRIANALGVMPSDFFEGIQEQPSGGLDWSKLADPQINALLNGFSKIPSPKVRAGIIELVTTLASQKD